MLRRKKKRRLMSTEPTFPQPASRTLQRLGGGGEIVVEIRILDHEIAGDDGQREVELDIRLSS